jgi:hypothetical protein
MRSLSYQFDLICHVSYAVIIERLVRAAWRAVEVHVRPGRLRDFRELYRAFPVAVFIGPPKK